MSNSVHRFVGGAYLNRGDEINLSTISRRSLLRAGMFTLAGTSGLLSTTNVFAQQDKISAEQKKSSMNKENLIRTYYSGYEKKDWNLSGGVLSDSFTFTSPNNDDHISKAAFKERCFLSQLGFVKQFELESILGHGDEAFVKYLCQTTKDTSFRNVEYFRFADEKIIAIECYFGGQLGYPSASATGKP